MNNEFEIKFLVDCKQHISSLAELWYEEISRHWVADASIEKVLKEMHFELFQANISIL